MKHCITLDDHARSASIFEYHLTLQPPNRRKLKSIKTLENPEIFSTLSKVMKSRPFKPPSLHYLLIQK